MERSKFVRLTHEIREDVIYNVIIATCSFLSYIFTISPKCWRSTYNILAIDWSIAIDGLETADLVQTITNFHTFNNDCNEKIRTLDLLLDNISCSLE